MNRTEFKNPLHEMTLTTPTFLWNDSASVHEITASMEYGVVGATCNPVIALTVAKQEADHWAPRTRELIEAMPTATEDRIGWKLVEEISTRGAGLLEPLFEKYKGTQGRLAIQTDPRFYRDPRAILDQAVHFSALAPNMIVKIPVTDAGITAIEEATSQGISILATVCFTVSQCVAVAEAVERGLERCRKSGMDTEPMAPICAIMVGRLDDWLKAIADKKGIVTDPGMLEWAGVAVFKRAYEIYKQRGYRTRLLSAAFRNHMHWSEFIGGDVIISPPFKWQTRFNASDIRVEPRISNPVDPEVLSVLRRKFADFVRGYDENGLARGEFDTYGPTVRTLRQFITACGDLSVLVRDSMLREPI